MSNSSDNTLWQTVYSQRTKFFEAHIGALPNEILKLSHLTGVWPGGGLYQIEAKRLGHRVWVHTTFGLSNVDLPTTTTVKSVSTKSGDGTVTSTELTLVRKENVPSYPNRPGYGYELAIATEKPESWPLYILQWAVNAEILDDADLLGRVSQYAGLTIEDLAIGEGDFVNVLIAKAKSPLPESIELSNGKAEILIATTITDDEMKWSMTNGRQELLDALIQSGNGQLSDLGRSSIFHPEPLDLATVKDIDSAKNYHEQGLLRKVYLFPLELGGPDSKENILYVPKSAALQKKSVDNEIFGMAERGLIDNYATRPEYNGDSVIPAALAIEATGEDKAFRKRIEIWRAG